MTALDSTCRKESSCVISRWSISTRMIWSWGQSLSENKVEQQQTWLDWLPLWGQRRTNENIQENHDGCTGITKPKFVHVKSRKCCSLASQDLPPFIIILFLKKRIYFFEIRTGGTEYFVVTISLLKCVNFLELVTFFPHQ